MADTLEEKTQTFLHALADLETDDDTRANMEADLERMNREAKLKAENAKLKETIAEQEKEMAHYSKVIDRQDQQWCGLLEWVTEKHEIAACSFQRLATGLEAAYEATKNKMMKLKGKYIE